jgi:streptomycin 6-kinase
MPAKPLALGERKLNDDKKESTLMNGYTIYNLPEHFTRLMIELHEDEGVAWLERLPALIDDCARRWSLTLLPPYPLSYNYVAPATRADGTPVVLKVGFPSDEIPEQIPALRHYDGHGMAQLLDSDPGWGAFVLERLMPGQTLAHVQDDEQATAIAAEVMRQIWRGPGGGAPPEHAFPSTADWAKGMQRMRDHFGGGTGPFPRAMVEAAESLFAELLASQAAPVLLHGDLHHENILSATRAPWLAIDPKGVIGEPAYELGALLRNPLPQLLNMPNPGRVMARRVDQLAEALGLDRARVRGWGLAQAVLSAWWCIEDSGYGWEPTIACAELLAAVKE